ncbi:MAG: extracellular solute-binding protein [Acidimicrobiales bacterium]
MERWKGSLITQGTVLTLALAVAGTLMAGCGGSSRPAHGLVLYNGQHVQTTNALVAAFEKATGLAVEVRSDDEAVLAAQIVAEGSHSPADVFYTENSPALEQLQVKHLLAPVPPSTLARSPARFDSPAGRWVGVSARVSVLVYNTRLLRRSQLPSSVSQLAGPRWKGRLALAPAETDFQPVVTAVDRAVGSKATVTWLDALKANAAGHIYPDNETVTDEVNKGQAAIGVIDQYYWYRLRAQLGPAAMHSAIATFAPRDPGYVVDVSGAGVLRSSAHRAAADRFLAFLASRRAQEIIAHSDSYEYPIDSGVRTRPGETPFVTLRPDRITVAELGTGATAVHLLQRAQLL